MWHDEAIAVVVPAFNEGRAIGRTIGKLPSWVDYIIAVDDCSTDDTWQELHAIDDARLIRVRHDDNRGVGAAIVTGYRRALDLKADVMVVMAGDDQMHPDDLPLLLDALRESGAAYVKGNRLIHPAWSRMPRTRRWGSRALSALTRWTSGLDVGDCQCGYTALRRDAAARLPLDDLWPRYGYPNDLLLLLAQAGLSVVEVPVAPVYADEKSGLHAGHVLTIAWRILGRWNQLQRRTVALTTAEHRQRPG